MKKKFIMPIRIIVLLIVVLGTSITSFAKEVPFTQEDRDRLIRLEAKIDVFEKRFEDINRRFEDINRRFEDINRRFEDINRRFEDINRRFEDINRQLNRITAIFTALVVAVIGFAIWDRRTMIRPFEKKVKDIEEEIAENRSKLRSLIEALQDLSKKNNDVAEVLRRFNLM